MLETLNIQKLDFENIENYEKTKITNLGIFKKDYTTIEQNLIRSWLYLSKTHKLEAGACLVIRALPVVTEEDKRKIKEAEAKGYFIKKYYQKEMYITNYNKDSYKAYRKFILDILKYKKDYNFFYNIYTMSFSKIKEAFKQCDYPSLGTGNNSLYTTMLIADFDGYTKEQYIKLKKFLNKKGIEHTIDIMSGNGYHITILLNNPIYDKDAIKKFVYILNDLGFAADKNVVNPGRIMRLPFFYNLKPEKYSTFNLSEIVNGERNTYCYDIEEIFSKLGYDYNTYSIEEVIEVKETKVREKSKKEEINITYQSIEDEELRLYYGECNINLSELPIGIKNMLKGFKKGYSMNQVYSLTIYFKFLGYCEDEIVKILRITEDINGNSWNTWDIDYQVNRIYNNDYRLTKELRVDLEEEFGEIKIDYNDYVNIPLGIMKPNCLKMYIYLLVYGQARKIDFINNLGISKTAVNDALKYTFFDFDVKTKRITINEENVKIIEEQKATIDTMHYCKVSKYDLDKYLEMDSNQIAVYLYLKFRIRSKKNLQICRDLIAKDTLLSIRTISKTIKSLEENNIITVQRYSYNEKEQKGESNNYSLNV